MSGKIIGIVILVSALMAGAVLYYLQVYAFYDTVAAPVDGVTAVSVVSGEPEVIPSDAYKAIDADSSPIRYRACFTTPYSLALMTETFEIIEDATPRNAPGWFDCFDAKTLSGELETGTAIAFLGAKNVHYGVDRIVAVTDDGRGYVWHELNDCGDKSYDGSIVGEECPEPPER